MTNLSISEYDEMPADLRDAVTAAYLKFDSSDCDPTMHVIMVNCDDGVNCKVDRWDCNNLVAQIAGIGRGGVAAESVRIQMRESVSRLRLPLPDGLLRVVVATPPKMYVLHLEKPTVFDG